MSKEKEDQRITAWKKIAKHPLWKDCFEAGDSLQAEMLAKMDRLWAKENPLPTEPGTVFRATEIRGGKCDVKVLVCEPAWDDRGAFYISHKRIQGARWHYASDITAWEPIENGDK